jgi:hypothetical protein
MVMNTLNDLHKISGSFSNTEKMPVFFFRTRSPMNAIKFSTIARFWKTKQSVSIDSYSEHYVPLIYTLGLKKRKTQFV